MEGLSRTILLSHGWRRVVIALGAGAATALALAPFHLFAVAFATFPVLVWLLDGATGVNTGRRTGAMLEAFTAGFWFGYGYFLAGTWWIANALLVEAPEFAWAVPLAVFGLPVVLAVFWGLATMVARLAWSDGPGRLFALAAAFGLAEWLRSFALTGFPWNAIGYGLAPEPVMMQAVQIAGIFGLSAFAVLVFSLPATLASTGKLRLAGPVLAVLLLVSQAGFGAWRLSTAGPLEANQDTPLIRLVQPSFLQTVKMDPQARAQILDTLVEMTVIEPAAGSEPAGVPSIVIWPETAVPYLLTRDSGALAAIAGALAPGQMLLTGAVREEAEGENSQSTGRYYNSVMLISPEGEIAAASDKVHLVPFGEYLPFAGVLSRLGLRQIADADRGYSPAASRALITMPGGTVILPLICYEAIFPALLQDADVQRADMILNLTNDSWFGRTPGPWQHLHQARLRAVETGLPLVRVANSGITGIYDGHGRETARMALDQRGVVDERPPTKIQPLYAAQTRNNNYWLLIAALGCIGLVSRVRR